MLHIYCGNGKGKTTAAVGLAVRAAGAGLSVRFYQFLKNGSSSEISVLGNISGITVRCCEECRCFTSQMTEADKEAVVIGHNALLSDALSHIADGSADLVVLDEFLDACNKRLIDRELAEQLVLACHGTIELVLTGRAPSDKFMSAADYISEINEVKHPYSKGVCARKGIEY